MGFAKRGIHIFEQPHIRDLTAAVAARLQRDMERERQLRRERQKIGAGNRPPVARRL